MVRRHYRYQSQIAQKETQLTLDAHGYFLMKNYDAAISKYQEIIDLHGDLESSATDDIRHVQELKEQENSLIEAGKKAFESKDFPNARSLYEKASQIHGPRESEALQALTALGEIASGATIF